MRRSFDIGIGLVAGAAFAIAGLLHNHAAGLVICLIIGVCGVALVAFDVGNRRGSAFALHEGTGEEARLVATRPNFEAEIREADGIIKSESVDSQTVDAWVEKVHSKLLGWSPKAADQFDPPVLKETPESAEKRKEWHKNPPSYKPPLESLLRSLHETQRMLPPSPPSPVYDAQLVRLKTYRDRLVEMVSPSNRALEVS